VCIIIDNKSKMTKRKREGKGDYINIVQVKNTERKKGLAPKRYRRESEREGEDIYLGPRRE